MLLKSAAGRRFHWCSACEQVHPIPPQGWTFNGSPDRPSFEPSLKQTYSHWTGGVAPNGLGRGEHLHRICHYFIRDGLIQFCPDSWHGRSDIVALPSIPDEAAARLDRIFSEE